MRSLPGLQLHAHPAGSAAAPPPPPVRQPHLPAQALHRRQVLLSGGQGAENVQAWRMEGVDGRVEAGAVCGRADPCGSKRQQVVSCIVPVSRGHAPPARLPAHLRPWLPFQGRGCGSAPSPAAPRRPPAAHASWAAPRRRPPCRWQQRAGAEEGVTGSSGAGRNGPGPHPHAAAGVEGTSEGGADGMRWAAAHPARQPAGAATGRQALALTPAHSPPPTCSATYSSSESGPEGTACMCRLGESAWGRDGGVGGVRRGHRRARRQRGTLVARPA